MRTARFTISPTTWALALIFSLACWFGIFKLFMALTAA